MDPYPLKILAIDDEKLLLWALQRAFKGRYIQTKTATTNEQALAEIEECHFDLFLIDFDLRDQNRLELLNALDESCPYVPIIFMTTSSIYSSELINLIRSTRKKGAWHLLEKPFSLDRLISFIDVIFKDQGNVKLSLTDLSHNYDSEKRQSLRRPHVQPVHFSFSTIVDGVSTRVSSRGILTDISDCGSGILAHEQLQPDQVISFEDDHLEQCGVVSWSVMIESETCRFGVQFR